MHPSPARFNPKSLLCAMRIIFMGTPEFAVASLAALVESGAKVVAVITATDKFGGRGGKTLLQSAVKKYAVSQEIPVLQPKNLKGKNFLATLRTYKADLQVVVAFRMLPKLVWAMPPFGTINVHGSLLPAYRGAAPIHWAVINGEQETGVTTFFLKHAIDTGDLLLQKRLAIGPNESTGEVYQRLMALGAEALVESIDLIAQGKTQGTPQDDSKVSHAPKIYHDTAKMDWSASAKTCHDLVRGMNPFPAAWTTMDGNEVKVLKTIIITDPEVLAKADNHKSGTLIPLHKGETYTKEAPGIAITTGENGLLELLEVKPAGKRKMSGADFRNGIRLEEARVI